MTPEDRARDGHYVSTYCQHGAHSECRLACKVCAERCRCSCHPWASDELQSVDTEPEGET